MKIFKYMVDSSPGPGSERCLLPYISEGNLAFSGPCFRHLRERLKAEVLRDREEALPTEDLFVVVFDRRNNNGFRRIVWTGRIRKLMTFEKAFWEYAGFDGGGHPVHVEPLYLGDLFVGYKLRSPRDYKDGTWVYDVASLKGRTGGLRVLKDRVILEDPAERFRVLDRDCFIVFEDLYIPGMTLRASGTLLEEAKVS